MALAHCTHCASAVALNALSCPHCGANAPLEPLPSAPTSHSPWRLFLSLSALLALALLSAWQLHHRTNTASDTEQQAQIGVGIHLHSPPPDTGDLSGQTLALNTARVTAAKPHTSNRTDLEQNCQITPNPLSCLANRYRQQAEQLCIAALKAQGLSDSLYWANLNPPDMEIESATIFASYRWANAQQTALAYELHPALFADEHGYLQARRARCLLQLPRVNPESP